MARKTMNAMNHVGTVLDASWLIPIKTWEDRNVKTLFSSIDRCIYLDEWPITDRRIYSDEWPMLTKQGLKDIRQKEKMEANRQKMIENEYSFNENNFFIKGDYD